MYRVIFEHHPKPGQEAAFIKQWQAGSDVTQTYPGARGTKLFRSLDDPGTLYAMTEWESKEARNKAIAAIEQRDDADWVLNAHEQFLDSYSTIVSGDLIAASDPPQA